jgi:hypothetical protein
MIISYAGGNAASGINGGLSPALFNLPALTGRTLLFSSVTGTTDCDGGSSVCSPTGPDGNLGADAIIGANSQLSGITIRGGLSLPLMGVFLDNGLPGAAPASLDFRNVENFASLSPLLGQLFWVGDGLTGTNSGSPQIFNVPDTATRLFLGFYDPQPNDNSGVLTAQFTVTGTGAVPEPASGWLLAIGLLALLTVRRVVRG